MVPALFTAYLWLVPVPKKDHGPTMPVASLGSTVVLMEKTPVEAWFKVRV